MTTPGKRRRALVTGLTGQDGSYVAELLLDEGYEVVGMVRTGRGDHLGAAEHLRGRVELIGGDLAAPESLVAAVANARPDELYHLAAPTFAPDSWNRPAQSFSVIAGATATLLEAVRDRSPKTRAFVAVSGAIFGAAPESPQREDTVCRPGTPYATAKLAVHQLIGQLRVHDELFACSGILYNHESSRRPVQFVSRKVTRAAAAIRLGLQEDVELGDLHAVRDWSFAGDVMRGAWLMLQQDRADDYILASGVPHTVAELAEIAFSHVGLEAADHIRFASELQRAPDLVPLVGDPSHARKRLGWRPTMDFQQLIESMVDADLRGLRAGPE